MLQSGQMSFVKSLFTISLAVGVVALLCTFETFKPYREHVINLLPQFLKTKLFGALGWEFTPSKKGDKLFTVEQLRKYRGENGQKIYLAILGQVFDVSKGRKHYGPGGSYHFFTGVAGTRAFVTGDFTEYGLSDDISDLKLRDIRGIAGWVEFYHKEYKYIGKLIGNFYDKHGKPTAALEDYKQKYDDAKKEQMKEQEDIRRFPPCNSETKVGISRRVWCSTNSGGIQRDWAGLPRQYFQPGQPQPRCACVKDSGPPSIQGKSNSGSNNGDLDNPHMKVYENCEPTATSCSFKD